MKGLCGEEWGGRRDGERRRRGGGWEAISVSFVALAIALKVNGKVLCKLYTPKINKLHRDITIYKTILSIIKD